MQRIKSPAAFHSNAAAICLLCCSGAAAAGDSYFAVGAGAGDVDVSGFDLSFVSRIHVGQLSSPNIGWELGYVDLGSFEATRSRSRVTVSAAGWEAALTARLSLTSRVSLFLKGGTYMWDVQGESFGATLGTDEGTDATVALGLLRAWGYDWAVRAEWQTYFDVSDADIQTGTVALMYRF